MKKYNRQSKQKRLKSIYLISTEGNRTEVEYFNALNNFLINVVVKNATKGSQKTVHLVMF